MLDLFDQIEAAAATIRRHVSGRPRVGVILGTGLGSLADQVAAQAVLRYDDIPHFPPSTAVSHAGKLICGDLAGLPVVVMSGRVHAYEGYSLAAATLPVHVMKALGAELIVLSNAAGGLNPHYQCGDVVVIDDHINLMFDNPLMGANDDRLGPRFPDMSRPYDRSLVERAQSVALREGIPLHRGVYAALKGPNLETRAEYRFLRSIGADMVGMSTVPENIVAVHAGLAVLAFSIISNVCLPDALRPVTIDEIVRASSAAEPKLRTIVQGVLREWSTSVA
ncbi:MAG: purine-nucleoside phosphorylase [Planctomycetia bacterium]|nr:purine-nucleoside phosphorylase [Planctomycetia bacterium]